jgi:hypothetical protein
MDAYVQSFKPAINIFLKPDFDFVWVLGTDGNLWIEQSPFAIYPIPPG